LGEGAIAVNSWSCMVLVMAMLTATAGDAAAQNRPTRT
jgi:hypothetical protein